MSLEVETIKLPETEELQTADEGTIKVNNRLSAGEEFYEGHVLLDYEFRKGDNAYLRKITAPFAGTLEEILVSRSDSVEPGQDLVKVRPACRHEETYNDLCVICGADLKAESTKLRGSLGQRPEFLSVVHTEPAMKVSKTVAQTQAVKDRERLLESRKLVLVVDLDQTVLHATVDERVQEWVEAGEKDKKLSVEERIHCINFGQRPHYIKFRPHFTEFLKTMAELFELHVFTFGSRPYANAILPIIDPDKNFFGDRVLTRSELTEGNNTLKSMELIRLFPAGIEMCVILDDRDDVWRKIDNLVQVVKYAYFIGVGDVNAPPNSREAMMAASQQHQEVKMESRAVASEVNDATVLEGMRGKLKGAIEAFNDWPDSDGELDEDYTTSAPAAENGSNAPVEEGGTDGSPASSDSGVVDSPKKQILARKELNPKLYGVIKEKLLKHKYDQAIVALTDARPLLPKERARAMLNEMLVEIVEEHSELVIPEDKDRWLPQYSRILSDIHHEFYAQFDDSNGEEVPLVAQIMKDLCKATLDGCQITFETGVIPKDYMDRGNFDKHELVVLARKFGAEVTESMEPWVTHVIASRTALSKAGPDLTGMSKVQKAIDNGLHVVYKEWLLDSVKIWKRVKETKYRPDTIPAYEETVKRRLSAQEERRRAVDGGEMEEEDDIAAYLENLDESEIDPDDDDDDDDESAMVEGDDDDHGGPSGKRRRLEADEDEDEEDGDDEYDVDEDDDDDEEDDEDFAKMMEGGGEED
eukprot:Clim_evm20s151 gene=Clim_evmTU20s151